MTKTSHAPHTIVLHAVLVTMVAALLLMPLAGCATSEDTTSDEAAVTEASADATGDADGSDSLDDDLEESIPPTDKLGLDEADDMNPDEIVDSTDSAKSAVPDELVLDEQEGSAEEGAADASRAMPNLNNASERRALNMFLSNFSEVGLGLGYGTGYTFDRYSASASEYAQIAWMHIWQNGGKVEWGHWKRGNARISVAQMDRAVLYLTGMEGVRWTNVNRQGSIYKATRSYVYNEVTNGRWICGPAVTTRVVDNGNGTLWVNFDAYYQDNARTHYSVGDGSQYSMSESQLNRLLGVSGPNAQGSATVRAWWANGKWNFRLVTYTIFYSK